MGRTACTEPQCVYKGALYLYLTVELYLYSPYGLYGLYRASGPVQGQPLPLFYYNVDEKIIIFCSVVPIIFLNEVGNPGSQWSYKKTVKPTLLQCHYN